jgi:hypothetical protein
LLRMWCHSEDNLSKEMGKRMLVKYYKYWWEKYGERQGDKEKSGEKDKGDQLLNFVVFFCVAISTIMDQSNLHLVSTIMDQSNLQLVHKEIVPHRDELS